LRADVDFFFFSRDELILLRMYKDDENFLEQLHDARACKNTGDPVSLPAQDVQPGEEKAPG